MDTLTPVAVTTDVLHDLRDEARDAGRMAARVRQMVVGNTGSVTIDLDGWMVTLYACRTRATAYCYCGGDWSVRFIDIDGEEGIVVGYTTSDLGRI